MNNIPVGDGQAGEEPWEEGGGANRTRRNTFKWKICHSDDYLRPEISVNAKEITKRVR